MIRQRGRQNDCLPGQTLVSDVCNAWKDWGHDFDSFKISLLLLLVVFSLFTRKLVGIYRNCGNRTCIISETAKCVDLGLLFFSSCSSGTSFLSRFFVQITFQNDTATNRRLAGPLVQQRRLHPLSRKRLQHGLPQWYHQPKTLSLGQSLRLLPQLQRPRHPPSHQQPNGMPLLRPPSPGSQKPLCP